MTPMGMVASMKVLPMRCYTPAWHAAAVSRHHNRVMWHGHLARRRTQLQEDSNSRVGGARDSWSDCDGRDGESAR